MESSVTLPLVAANRSPGPHKRLAKSHAVMATFSAYPSDPRPRRAIEALIAEGMTIDLICLEDGKNPAFEEATGLRIWRIPIQHTRGNKVQYIYNYLAFIVVCAYRMAKSALSKRVHLAYVHNMPDVLVFSTIVPKLLGARVVLDQHDPMPELMTTIYGLHPASFGVRLIRFLEKLSLGFADRVITVNRACQRIFGERSCSGEKIAIVMNSPDERIFVLNNDGRGPEDADGRFVVMYHGSLVERNGLDLAVEALAKVRHLTPGIELRVFGHQTPFLKRVLQRASEAGLGDCVRYMGPRRLEELPAEISRCHVGVIPNHRNAFTDINTPTRIFEYLSVGKPVIAPRTQGIVDYFSTSSLLYFESGDPADLAQTLRFAYENRQELQSIADRGQLVLRAHTWTREREILLDTVASLLQVP